MGITLQVLETLIKNLGDSSSIGWYTLRDDAELIRLIVNGATKADIAEHLKETYPDYFEDNEQYKCPTCDGYIPNNENIGAYMGAMSRHGHGEAMQDFFGEHIIIMKGN